MKKRLLFILFGLPLPIAAQATEPDLPVATLPPTISRLIPAGYTALRVTWGNLNLDAFDDVILIVKKPGEEKTSDVNNHPEKRPLLLLIGQADGKYRVGGRNDNAVYCVDCGGMMGDPLMGVTIKNGYFSVEHYGGSGYDRWEHVVTFSYRSAAKDWLLSRDGTVHFRVDNPDKATITTRTPKDVGKVPFTAFDIYRN